MVKGIRTSRYQTIGGRTQQQDRVLLVGPNARLRGWLMAVMDGHGGTMSAQYAQRSLLKLFLETGRLSQALKRLSQQTALIEDGSTVSVVFIPLSADRVDMAWLGDSPIIVVSEGKVLFRSRLHNVSDRSEVTAAAQRGAILYNGYFYDQNDLEYGLQLSRSLGDSRCRFLNRKPQTASIRLPKISTVVVASDGLIEREDYRARVLEIAGRLKAGISARELAQAEARRAWDNLSVIVWHKNVERA